MTIFDKTRCEAKESGRRWRRESGQSIRFLFILGVVLVHLVSGTAFAARSRRESIPVPGPGTTAWITINATTGEVLAGQEPDRQGAPASMTKMMLALLVMEAVKDGQLRLSDTVQASRLASKMGGSQVYLKEGETFSVEEMMSALLIGSANDAAVALAERLAGSVSGGVRRMNDRGAALKLAATRFASVHGLPPGAGQDGDVATPRDMARLSQELVKFPDILRWTSTLEAPFRNGSFILRNSNHLIGLFPGADGLKTGHFREAGYNLAATASRGNLRLITVVMGAPSNKDRFAEAARLLEEGFSRYVEVTVAKAGIPLQGEIRLPRASAAFHPVTTSDLKALVLREQKDAIRMNVDVQAGLRAPLDKGQQVGTLVVRMSDREIAHVPVVTPADVPRAFFWWLTPWR